MELLELIKVLRAHRSGCNGCGHEHDCYLGHCELMQQAADALEKLKEAK